MQLHMRQVVLAMTVMINISDHEIEFAERLLLPAGETFDDQRREVIRCMESKDIQACPGSGKTTALLAKLSIIAQKLPFENNKGICVLTHTNVAVEEIRERLDGKTDILFQYPNHFGTIQSFINKFLAVPAYIDMFGKQPARIDNEIHNEYIERRGRLIPYGTKQWLENKNISLSALRFTLNDFDVISKTINGSIVVSAASPTYGLLKALKEGILHDGILCYDDAYSLAYWYLRKFPQLKEVVSERFAYVFIDEMQDTDKIQQGILDQVFDSKKVSVQKIGDCNQAIFESSSEMAWEVADDFLAISNSKRFSHAIAERVKTICLTPQDLRGNPAIPNINPKIIVFDDTSISQVIPKFGDLIYDNKLHMINKKIFKAIGWVGQTNTNRTLPSYFEPYGKLGGNKKQDFDSLRDYLKAAQDNQKGSSIAVIRLFIYRGLLKGLRLLGVKKPNGVPYTEQSFTNFLKNEHMELFELINLRLTEWCYKLYCKQDISAEIRFFFNNHICTQLGKAMSFELNVFLEAPASIQLITDQRSNTYIHKRENKEIIIDVSNVHSVKGETHTATLYLETFYRKYDIKSIVEFMKGNHTSPKTATLKNSLKMAYVGMTRPSHMLCVAAHKDGYEQHLDELASVGWEIHRL